MKKTTLIVIVSLIIAAVLFISGVISESMDHYKNYRILNPIRDIKQMIEVIESMQSDHMTV